MPDSDYGDFIATILKNLEKNGFPSSRVAFPVDALWQSADSKGLNFRKILDFLKEKGIEHEMDADKIIFSSAEPAEAAEATGMAGNPFLEMMSDPNNPMAAMLREQAGNIADLKGGNLFSKAMDAVKNMSPEQVAQLQNMMASLSDDEKKDLVEKAKNMNFSS